MCICVAYDNGQCSYYGVSVGSLTHGCTRGGYMAKEFAKAFYKSRAWLNCREAYILSVNGLCETCLKKQKLTPGKIVHHKAYITPENIHDPMVTLNHDNLRYDCQDCHNAEHHGNDNAVTAEGLAFDIDGNLIKLD